MGYAAEIFGIFYSQWDYQVVNISRILKVLTWHAFDEFGWNDPANPTEMKKKPVALDFFCQDRKIFVEACTCYFLSNVYFFTKW